MPERTRTTLDFGSLSVGCPVTEMTIPVTATRIVAGAIASRDFMPAHHDRDFANSQGAPDIFMNILSDTAYCSRFLTDWAGPDAMVLRIDIRLGVPTFPGHNLIFTGEVTALRTEGDDGVVEIAFAGRCDIGEHVTGIAHVRLPLSASS